MSTLSIFHAALLLLATVYNLVHSSSLSLDENNNDNDNRNDEFNWPINSGDLSVGLIQGQEENRIEDLRRDIDRLISIIQRKKILSSSLPFQSMDYVTQESKRTSDVRNAKKLIHGVNKRHCWDVADVCCMWNICS